MTWEQHIKDEEAKHEATEQGRAMLQSLARWLGADYDQSDLTATEESIARRLYKETACGAWINFDHEKIGITIGSIVEGSEAEVEASFMQWPFDSEQLDEAIQYVEDEVDIHWREANDEEI